jgi:hypothetical protein
MGPWWFAAARRAVIESQGSIPHALEARLRQLRGVGIPMSAAENSFLVLLVPKLVIEAVERPDGIRVASVVWCFQGLRPRWFSVMTEYWFVRAVPSRRPESSSG